MPKVTQLVDDIARFETHANFRLPSFCQAILFTVKPYVWHINLISIIKYKSQWNDKSCMLFLLFIYYISGLTL